MPGLKTLLFLFPERERLIDFGIPLRKLEAMLFNRFLQRLNKLLVIDPAVTGNPLGHGLIQVIAIFLLIIHQHRQLLFRLLTAATHFAKPQRGIVDFFLSHIFKRVQRAILFHGYLPHTSSY
ncbi:hypothetical protein BN131_212 [Cronobacter malonaticus 681]|nr:hypothetical protein BN131_212 [Cronobacter malonaticus 681]